MWRGGVKCEGVELGEDGSFRGKGNVSVGQLMYSNSML